MEKIEVQNNITTKPMESKMKKETLEEAAEKYVKSDLKKTPLYGMFNDTFIEGAKWQQEQAERHFENKDWAEVNSILLVNFLRMPDAHKIHLLVSIKERRPDLFESKPETEMKQETLEEAAEKHYEEQSREFENNTDNPIFDTSRYLVAGFIDGAKWQQEQLEKELNRFFLYFRDNGERLLGASVEQLVKSYLKSR
jgi:hypothetical protein